jgi:hypothetical protein
MAPPDQRAEKKADTQSGGGGALAYLIR